MIRPSKKGTTSLCPYKGEAQYYDVVLPDGSVLEDVIWVCLPECQDLYFSNFDRLADLALVLPIWQDDTRLRYSRRIVLLL